MSKGQYGLLIAFAVLAGLLGGFLSNQFLAGSPAFAQQAAKPAEIITAHEIRITDKDGNVRVKLGLSEASTAISSIESGTPNWKSAKSPSPTLTLMDTKGAERLVLALADDQPLLALHPDKKGQPAAILTLAASGPALLLENEAAKARMLLASTDQGPKLYIADEKGVRELKWATKIRLLDPSAPSE